jgi:hypothetical protein
MAKATCNDEQKLLKYISDICYDVKYKNNKKKFMWVCCADTILENLTNKKVNVNTVKSEG